MRDVILGLEYPFHSPGAEVKFDKAHRDKARINLAKKPAVEIRGLIERTIQILEEMSEDSW